MRMLTGFSVQTNGCGPSGWGKLVPDFVFRDACQDHDVAYGLGAPQIVEELMRRAVDDNFLYHMYQEIQTVTKFRPKRAVYRWLARKYHDSVVLAGARPFATFATFAQWETHVRKHADNPKLAAAYIEWGHEFQRILATMPGGIQLNRATRRANARRS